MNKLRYLCIAKITIIERLQESVVITECKKLNKYKL